MYQQYARLFLFMFGKTTTFEDGFSRRIRDLFSEPAILRKPQIRSRQVRQPERICRQSETAG